MTNWYRHKKMSFIMPSACSLKKGRYHGPISLVELEGGGELLRHQTSTILSVYPNAEIISVVGVDSYKVYRKNFTDVKILENERYEHTGIIHSVAIGLRQASYDHVVVLNGDLVFDKIVIQSITTDRSCLFVGHGKKSTVGVNVMNAHVISLAFGLNYQWEKLAFLTGIELKLFKKFVFDPTKEKFLLYEAFNYVINQGGVMVPIPPKGNIQELEDVI